MIDHILNKLKCFFGKHKWHYWQTEILRSTARKSRTYFNRECVLCKINQSLGGRVGPSGHDVERSLFR
jgi:hypothetical protein